MMTRKHHRMVAQTAGAFISDLLPLLDGSDETARTLAQRFLGSFLVAAHEAGEVDMMSRFRPDLFLDAIVAACEAERALKRT